MTRILLQPLPANMAHSLGAVLMSARIQLIAKMICDSTYGEEGVDWQVGKDADGIGITFKDPKQAMRFKLSWNPTPNAT